MLVASGRSEVSSWESTAHLVETNYGSYHDAMDSSQVKTSLVSDISDS